MLRHRIDHARLKKKADYFFKPTLTKRREITSFANALADLGPAVVIGGVLRDLHLGDLRTFRSDVDFVIDPVCMAEFDKFAAARSAKPNRFGGYAMTLGHWRADVWPLERTWASVNGHRHVRTLDDLLDVTFFDWDAILFRIGKPRRLLHRAGYFEAIASRTLDINLPENPNPLGNAVRALRYAKRFDAALTPRLAEHVARQIRDRGWGSFLESEKMGFDTQLLRNGEGDFVAERLRRVVARVVPFDSSQHELSFGAGYTSRGSPAPPDDCGGVSTMRKPRRRRPVMQSLFPGEIAFG